MPLITEDEFLLLSEVYQYPDTTPEEKSGILGKMREYEAQQKANNLALTPKLDKLIMQEEERTATKINELYSGVDNVPIPDNLKSVFSDSESRARYANESYLKYKYGKDFDSSEYDLYKADYANKNLNSLQPTSETEFYNSIKSGVDAENSSKKRLQTNFKKAIESFVSGEQPSVAMSRLSKELPNEFDATAFNNSYNSLSNIIKPYKSNIYKFTDAYERKLKGESKPEDETIITDFTNQLSEMPDEHRQLSLIFLRNRAKEKGLDSLKTRGAFSGLADDFSKSFKRIYGEGFAGRNAAELEQVLSVIPNKGTVNTAVPVIDSLEAAKKYVNEQATSRLGAKVAEALIAGEPTVSPFTYETLFPIEGATQRELTPDESAYISQALKESRKPIAIDREIRNIGSVLDPVSDNWMGLMAGTLGSSAAVLLPMAVSGPAGGVLATDMYRGMEYNSLMSKYPDMNPSDADNVALVSGALQGALDFAEVGLLKSLGGKLAKKFAPGMAAASVEGAYLGDSILADMGLTYLFENAIEGVQDFTTPIVQEAFSRFNNAVPSVDFQSELKDWVETRPDVAIGMIPLTIFGGAMSAGTKLYSNSRLLREASDIEKLTDAGIVESDRLTLSKMVENRDVEGIRSFLPEAWGRRDMNLVQSRVAEKMNDRLLSVNAAATLNAAIQAGAIPNFTVNESGQYLVEGVETPFNTREEVMGYITGRINDINTAKSEIITDSVSNVEKTTTDLNISADPVQLDAENDVLSKLNGLNQNKVAELNNSFGDKVQQDRVFKQITNDIFSGKKTAETALKDYIDGIYNNLPTSTKDALGVDETSGKQALFDLVTMTKDKVQSAARLKVGSLMTTVYDNIQQLNKFNRFIGISTRTNDFGAWKELNEYAKRYNSFLRTNPSPEQIKKFEAKNSNLAKQFPYSKKRFDVAAKFEQNQLIGLAQLQKAADTDYAEDLKRPKNERRFQKRPMIQVIMPEAVEGATQIEASGAWLESFKAVFGANIVLISNTENARLSVEGMYDANADTIFVDVNSSGAIPWTVGHEYLHRIRAQQPEIYAEIVKVINSRVTEEQRNGYFRTMSFTYFMDDKMNKEFNKNSDKILKLRTEIDSTFDGAKIAKLENQISELINKNSEIEKRAEANREEFINTPESERKAKYVKTPFFGLGVEYSKNDNIFQHDVVTKEFVNVLEEEFVADFFAKNFTDPEFWNFVLEKNGDSFFKKIVDSLLKYINDLIKHTIKVSKQPPNDNISDIVNSLGDEMKVLQKELAALLDIDVLRTRTFTPTNIRTDLMTHQIVNPGATYQRFAKRSLQLVQQTLNNSTRLIPGVNKLSSAQTDELESAALHIATELNVANPKNVKLVGGVLSWTKNATPQEIETIDRFNAFVKEFSQQYEVNVVFFEQVGGQAENNGKDFFGGFWDEKSRTIFVNYKTTLPFMVLYGHEFGHSIETTDNDLYTQLVDNLFDIIIKENPDALKVFARRVNEYYYTTKNKKDGAANKAEYLKYLDNIKNNVPAFDKISLTQTDVDQIRKTTNAEIGNDLIGYMFTDRKVFDDLHKKDKSLFDKLLRAMWDFTDAIVNYISGKYKIEDITGKQAIEEAFTDKGVKEITLSLTAYESMRSLLVETMDLYKTKIPSYGINRAMTGMQGRNIRKGQPTTNFSASITPATITQTPNSEVQHVVNKIRNTVSSARVLAEKARQRGDKTAGMAVEETIAEVVSPINEESFNAAAKSRAIDKNTMEAETWLARAKILKNSLRKALSNNDTSLNALANAAAILNGSYSDVSNLNEIEKVNYVSSAIKQLNNELKVVYLEELEMEKTVFSELENQYRSRGQTDIADMFGVYNSAFNETDPSGAVSQLFNDLYTSNGVPVAKDAKEYNEKLLKYNILKTIGNADNMTADQLENVLKTLENFISSVDSSSFIKDIENLVNGMRYISETSQSLEKRELDQFNKMNNLRNPLWTGAKKIFQPLTDMIASFTDSHLTFASLIELVYPNNVKTNAKTYTRMAELTDIVNDTSLSDAERADASVELGILRESIGKAIVPEMQKVVDDLRNAYTDILLDNDTNEDNLRKAIAKAFNLESSAARVVNKKLYSLVDRAQGFTVKINNRDYLLSQAYAGYILNLSDTGIYDKQLSDNGFTSDVISNIRKGISKEANEIRLELRKLIRKEHQKANEQSLKTMGFGTIIPDENFYPVQYKSTTSSVIDAFDINFQGGITDKDSEAVLDSSGRDIELDLNVQAINMFSMFSSHMYISTHKRNVVAPVTVAKAVLSDKKISERISAAFGNDFYQQLFKLLGALETNGVRTVEMSRTWRNYMRGLMSGAAKGSLAMNPTTILLNATSVFNTGLDTSIPFNRAISSYGRVLLATLSGNKLGKIPKTAKEIRNFDIIKQRIKNGANSLMVLSKTDPTISKPTILTEAGDLGMRPISLSDGYFGSFAAAAAYDAHYRMAKDSGVSDAEATVAAEEGMKRTIQTTFQPNTVANKATVEVGSNIVMRMLGMFMSEARKAVGLELTAIKKNGVFSKEFGRFVIVNHFIIGGLSYLIRSAIKDALKDEDEDEDIWNPAQLAQNILVGPLAGLFIVGTAIESSAIWLTNMLIDSLDVKGDRAEFDLYVGNIDSKVSKLPVFPKDNIISSTAKQLQKAKDILEAETVTDSVDAAITFGKGFGAVLNNSAISGTTTIAKTMKTIVDAIDENGLDIMEEPEKK